MTCDEARLAYLESRGEDTDAREHLESCAECRPMTTDLDDVLGALGEAAVWEEPSAGLADDVVRAVVAAAHEAPATESSDVVDLAARRADRSSHRATGRSVTRWSVPLAAAAVAAAVVLVVVIAGGRLSSGSGREVQLAATSLAPSGAGGSARVSETSSGIRIHLDAPGLPRAADGTYYAAWLKGDRGLVPIGSFHSGDDVTLWAGVPLDRYPTLTVTLEPDDGNPASSGQVVLTGEVGTR